MEQALSLISRYSAKASKPTFTATTKIQPQEQSQQPSFTNNPEATQQHEGQKLRQIQKKMATISLAQQTLHQKCKKIIQNLTNQIKLKEQNNTLLQKEIDELKESIETSKADLEIIVNYIHKQKNKEPKIYQQTRQKEKLVLDSTKDSGRLEKSNSGTIRSPIEKNGSANKLKERSRPTLALFQGSKSRRNKSDLFLL